MSTHNKIECFATPDGRAFLAREESTTHKQLPPGVYKYDLEMNGMWYHQQEIPSGIVIPDRAQQEVMAEIGQFWSPEAMALYAKLGFPHKRGVLLYGPPGTGKTTLIKMVVQDVIKRGGIALELCHAGEFQSALTLFRDACPDTPVVVTIEDLDRYMHGHEELILGILDGSYAINHVLFIASTNKKDDLSERLTRPSRFDCPKMIDLPDEAARRRYIEGLLPGSDKAAVEALVKESKNESIAHLKERVLQRLIYSNKTRQKT